MSIEDIDEIDLIQTVFSNDQGRKLLAYWQEIYGKRISFMPENTPETTAFMEGNRAFLLAITNIMELPRK